MLQMEKGRKSHCIYFTYIRSGYYLRFFPPGKSLAYCARSSAHCMRIYSYEAMKKPRCSFELRGLNVLFRIRWHG